MSMWFCSIFVISQELSGGKFSHNGDLLFYRDHEQAHPTMTKVPQACSQPLVKTASSPSLNTRVIRKDVEELKKRHVELGRTFDWNFLDRLGARAFIDGYLSQDFCVGNLSFTCNAWRRSLNMREPIFEELVIEPIFFQICQTVKF